MVNSRRRDFDHKKRIVVKVGSSTISHGTGKLNYRRMEHLVRELADLQNQGKEMILVSSGATNAGMAPLNLDKRPKSIREKQALAAVGQGVLMHTYERLFREYGQVVGQVLLTRMDSQDRSKFMHSRNALLTMIDMGIIPIINENDVVAVDEYKIGDNDTLSAMVSGLVDANLLILLSDIDGLYTDNPRTHADAKIISYVDNIDKHIYDIAGDAGSSMGTGGMYTKIQAAPSLPPPTSTWSSPPGAKTTSSAASVPEKTWGPCLKRRKRRSTRRSAGSFRAARRRENSSSTRAAATPSSTRGRACCLLASSVSKASLKKGTSSASSTTD